MLVRKLTAEDYIALIDRIVGRRPDYGFTRKRHRLIYSGPRDEVAMLLMTDFARLGLTYCSNVDRAQEEAKETGAIRIDDTFIGRFLNHRNLRIEFRKVYSNRYEADDAALRVWKHASLRFLEKGGGKLSSVGPGADPARVMCSIEIPAAVRNHRYKTANEVKFDPLRVPGSAIDTTRWFVLAELTKWHRAAWRKRSQKFYRRFLERREKYHVSRLVELKYTAKDGRPLYQYTAEERHNQNQKSIVRFAALNMQPIETAIEHEKATAFSPYSAAPTVLKLFIRKRPTKPVSKRVSRHVHTAIAALT